MTRFVQGRRGFTLMELLTVMVIMSIVLATGVVSYVGARRGAELRGAAISVKTALSMARQHAVTKRRTTAVVFRLQGTTNCYYVFEKDGVASQSSSDLYMNPTSSLPPVGMLVCNLSVSAGQIGTASAVSGNTAVRRTIPLAGETLSWTVGDGVGFQANEKMFIPPGVTCKLDDQDNGIVLFYPNGKAAGLGTRTIKLYDKMDTAIVKTLTVYPLVGLIKAE